MVFFGQGRLCRQSMELPLSSFIKQSLLPPVADVANNTHAILPLRNTHVEKMIELFSSRCDSIVGTYLPINMFIVSDTPTAQQCVIKTSLLFSRCVTSCSTWVVPRWLRGDWSGRRKRRAAFLRTTHISGCNTTALHIVSNVFVMSAPQAPESPSSFHLCR